MDAYDVLNQLESELQGLEPEPWSSAAEAWRLRAVEAFRELIGGQDNLVDQMENLDFAPYIRPLGVSYAPSGWGEIFEAARAKGLALVEALRYRMSLDGVSRTVSGSGSDHLERLHPRIQEVSSALFRDGHYPQAILEAFKAVELRVKRLSAVDQSGRDLMATAFGESRHILALNDLATRSDKDEQEGFRLIFMGAVQGIRNPKAHDIIEQEDPDRALDYLGLASLLMRRLDDVQGRLTE